ncbi:MAG: hypothetical protein ACHREM_16340 [Polyangiales bacterium]
MAARSLARMKRASLGLVAAITAITIAGCRRESPSIKRADETPKVRACEVPADGIATASLVLNAPCDAKLPKGLRVGAGSRLEIGPGVRLAFGAGTGLVVETGGSIAAKGTAESPIVLTSMADKPDAGDWLGVRFVDPIKLPTAPEDPKIARARLLDDESFAILSILGNSEVPHRRPFSPFAHSSPSPSPAPSASASASSSARSIEASPASVLAHVVVEHAGAKPKSGETGALVVERATPGLQLLDVAVRSSAHLALFVARNVDPASIEAMSALKLSSRDGVVASVPAELLGRLGDSIFDGTVQTYGRVSTSARWPASAAKIEVTSDLIVDGPTSPTLTLAESSRLAFALSSGLFVASGPAKKGALVASKITFTGARAPARAGDWRGITLDGVAKGTRIVSSTIEFAGEGAIEMPKDERGVEIHDDTFTSFAGVAIESWTDCTPFRLKTRAIIAPAGKICTFHEPPKPLDFGAFDGVEMSSLSALGSDSVFDEIGGGGLGTGAVGVPGGGGSIAGIGGGDLRPGGGTGTGSYGTIGRTRGAEGTMGAPAGAGSASGGHYGVLGSVRAQPSAASAASSSAPAK